MTGDQMPEILTESFCERCGTRYTFQAAAPKRTRTAKIRILSRGLRNYVLSDDTTLAEALAEARSDEERAISAHQLEAFHQTFNFCLSCRQYTCANCWNEVEARCLTCAPNLSHEVLAAPFPNLVPTSGNGGSALAEPPLSAWPKSDLVSAPTDVPSEAPLDDIVAARLAALDPGASPGPTQQPVGPPTIASTPADASTDDRAAAAVRRTRDLLARFRPGQRIDAAIEAFELAERETIAEREAAESQRAAGAAPEPVAAEPEPVAAEPEPVAAEPEPVAAEPEPVAAEPEARPTTDRGAWRVVAPEVAAPGHNGPSPDEPALPAAATAGPSAREWSTSPQWPPRNPLAASLRHERRAAVGRSRRGRPRSTAHRDRHPLGQLEP